jgi:recombinational DNA repair ATPase RecF
VKIKQLSVKHYKGFQASFTLDTDGKNVLILGENGSGKTSLVRALEDILNSSRRAVAFQHNVFVEEAARDGAVSVTLDDTAASKYTLKQDGSSTAYNVSALADAAKSKRFLEYRGLLKTYFLTGTRVNVFTLLIEDILADAENPLSQRSFAEDWEALKTLLPMRNTEKNTSQFNAALETFVNGLQTVLNSIQREAQQMLNQFDPSLEFHLEMIYRKYEKKKPFIEPSVWLNVRFRDKNIDQHHAVLNEARLSAIAICLYFAAALQTPPSDLRVLVLDDVLIGLDMENRLPLLDILRMPGFKDHQVFLLTYDPVWFDVVQSRMPTATWKSLRMFVPSHVETGIPVIEDENLLARAKVHLDGKDFKAAAIYARSAFERLLKRFCEDNEIKVRFVQNLKSLDTNDLFTAACDWKAPGNVKPITDGLKSDVIRVRVLLNRLSHSEVLRITESEVREAIWVMRLLETTLEPYKKKTR